MNGSNYKLDTQRKFAKLSELKAGDFIEHDGGYSCTMPGEVTRLKQDAEGLFFICNNGRHYLEARGDGTVIGIYKAELESVPIIDPITTKPIIEGAHGKAWKCDTNAGLMKMRINPADDSCLVHWVIEAPWAHPAWHSYSLLCIHLRPLAGKPPAVVHFPDATHELWLFAIDPNKDRNKLLKTGEVIGHWLQPINFAAQFIEITDEEAEKRIEASVRQIVAGTLSPDTDFRTDWVRLWGDNMVRGKR